MNTLITGASSGIGEALALECARRRDRLFLCGRDAGRLEDVARRCRAMDAPTYATVVDVTDREATRAWIHSCEAIAPVERVFANAGVGTGVEDERNVRRTFDTNVGGTLNTVLPAIDLFRSRRGGGQIVVTASIAGYGPLKSCPAYSATKSCIKTWGLALRGMLAPEGIRVSVVCPGFVRSRITDRNTCPMPFFMEADKAAQIILRRADRNVGLIAFPWQMRFASWALSALPFRLNEFINRFLPAKVSPDRDKAL
ncbi:MAG: SDR family NAD(P)-dependent oxidoreductase [Kiritimatiellae bacterium]|nr:SDR family NAD(P)-dependent oxidoreductase [Kiritimatiellia bacterium]